MKELIITGLCSRECAIAAAVVLKSLKGEADVVGMSKRNLPQFLSKDKLSWKRIHILGVSLGGNEGLLADALAKLSRKVEVSWVGCEPLTDSQNKAIRPLLKSAKCIESAGDVGRLVKAVAKAYRADPGDLKKFVAPDGKMSERERSLDELLDASIYAYRTCQDQLPYRRAIACLASGDTTDAMSGELKRVVARYRQYGDRELVASGSLMREVIGSADIAAANQHGSIMLLGETGTGKSAFAYRIHSKSPRRNEPYVTFNCASLPADAVERQLYGCAAKWDGDQEEGGAIDNADGGTIFLDNIDEMPAAAQGILLRLIDRGRFVRVGGHRERRVDVRVVSASSRNLPMLVREGKFRSDLYLRLSVVQLRIPALRERKEDIAQIAQKWWEDRHRRRLTEKQVAALCSYDYPCNVRELLNILHRATILGEGDFKKIIDAHMTANAGFFDNADSGGAMESVVLEDVIRRHVKDIFVKCGKNGSRAAAILKIARNTLHKYVKEDDVDDEAHVSNGGK